MCHHQQGKRGAAWKKEKLLVETGRKKKKRFTRKIKGDRWGNGGRASGFILLHGSKQKSSGEGKTVCERGGGGPVDILIKKKYPRVLPTLFTRASEKTWKCSQGKTNSPQTERKGEDDEFRKEKLFEKKTNPNGKGDG